MITGGFKKSSHLGIMEKFKQTFILVCSRLCEFIILLNLLALYRNYRNMHQFSNWATPFGIFLCVT